MHKVTCFLCGSPFSVHSSKFIRNKRFFCRRGCYNIAMRTGSLKNGYKVISVDGKQVLEHRVIVEKSIGRSLLSTEHVHHIDHNRLNNKISNLEIVTLPQHTSIHQTRDDITSSDFINLWRDGHSTHEIAAMLNCGQTTVRRRLNKLGVSTSRGTACIEWDINQALDMRRSGTSYNRIGSALGVSGTAIINAFKRRGLSD